MNDKGQELQRQPLLPGFDRAMGEPFCGEEQRLREEPLVREGLRAPPARTQMPFALT
jgi:hypothetical protein